MDEIEEEKESVLDDPDLRLLVAVWCIGVLSFGLGISCVRKGTGNQILRQKFENKIKLLKIPLIIITLPLIYVPAYQKEPPLPRSKASSFLRTWIFRYPRGCTALIIHIILGTHFGHHNRLQQMYAFFVLSFFLFDSASLLLLSAQIRCIAQKTCAMPRSYSFTILKALQLRDITSIILHLWAIILLGCLIVMTTYAPSLPLAYGRLAYKRKQAMRAELARCNFEDDLKKERPRLPPVFGMYKDRKSQFLSDKSRRTFSPIPNPHPHKKRSNYLHSNSSAHTLLPSSASSILGGARLSRECSHNDTK